MMVAPPLCLEETTIAIWRTRAAIAARLQINVGLSRHLPDADDVDCSCGTPHLDFIGTNPGNLVVK